MKNFSQPDEIRQDDVLRELGIDPVAFTASKYSRAPRAESPKQPAKFPSQDELLSEAGFDL